MENYIELTIVAIVFITASVLLMLNYLHDFSRQTMDDDTDDRLPNNRKSAASGAAEKRGR